MFTGIITDVGRVRSIAPIGAASDMRLVVETAWPADAVAIGASVACSGCCLTVVAAGEGWLAFDVSGETLAKTTLGSWRVGTRLNLERALRFGDELGGHLVAGHVDGVGELVDRRDEAGSRRLRFAVPAPLGRYIAQKGSVAIDGVSLTVNDVEDTVAAAGSNVTVFGVNIIPHTQAATTLGELAVGDPVNVEVDTLARYVARMNEAGRR